MPVVGTLKVTDTAPLFAVVEETYWPALARESAAMIIGEARLPPSASRYGVEELETVTDTADEVALLPAASLATAVMVCVPFATCVVAQEIE